MHINAKRMKRRIEREQGASMKFYGSANLIDDAETLTDPITTPDYVNVKDYRQRAARLGISITETADEHTGKTLYTISGGCMEDLDESPETYTDTAELKAAINELWDTMTEPTAEYYTDGAGRLHKYIEYPELDY